MMNKIPNFPGYQITEPIYSGTRTLVYRGVRKNDQQPVVIKLLRNEYPNFHELIQFRNQYTIAKNLDFPSIIKPLSLEVYRNGYLLVMEDFAGISLYDYLKSATDGNSQSKYLPLENFLKIAIQLIEALHYLCQNRVIHKDIKPANILISHNIKQVKLIDFSIASLLPRETQEIQNANDLEGTLAYLSPEQTGRMNRGIDYRSDFYSLGVTFYELLTGTLPFCSEDAMELVHCHLAKQPIPIHQIHSEIPIVLSEIVSKLIEKNAEDRYQSALGIKHDLDICLAQLQATGTIEPFEIGKRDISDRFLIPEKLYGRETEVNQLLNAFERVTNGTTEMMLIAGFSGIGKTAVVNEVHKPIVRQRGYFLKGKYDQFQRNIPFSAFVQAFRDLIGQLLSESDEKLQTWKTHILEALGDSGQVLIDVIPELENIIGKQPPAIELSGTAAQNRFNLLFQKFVKVFTRIEHPLVMFLDDLQWADSASLNLLSLLMQDSGYLLILGAYRDNEVSPVHPFILTIDELVKTGATVNTMTLPPLRESDINRLVADTLNCELSVAQPLTKLVYQKTQGNPFFATQFLKSLHDDKLITFNWEIQHWQCDIAQINALAMTDDVVEFMALQLQKLPIPTQDILKLAACIGAQFDLPTLAIVSEHSETETATVLWRALQEGLLLPISNVYKFYQIEGHDKLSPEDQNTNQQNARYRFLHDRVQQAAYSLIPDEQKQVTHLKIGQLMLNNIPQSSLKEKIFDIVNHLNIGSELICDPTQREQLASLNLMAGQKAKVATAYADAVRYLNVSLALLEAEKWHSQYDLMLLVHIEAAEAEYLNTNFQKLASLAEIVLEKAKTILDQMKIYELQIQSYQLQGLMLKAIETGLEALEKLGILLSANICDRPMPDLPKIEDLDSIPEMKDRRQLTALRIMMALYPPIYIAKPDTIRPLILTMVQLCLEGGHSALAAYTYVLYGIILCAEKGRIEQGYHAGQIALKLLDKFHATELKSRIYLLFNAHIRFRKEPVQLTLNAYLEGYQSGLETGDIEWASYNCMQYCKNLFITGKDLELVEKEQASYQSVIVKNNHEFALYYARIWMQIALNLQGKATDNLKLIGKDFDESLVIPLWKSNNNYMSLFALYVAKANLAYLFDDVTEALDSALIAKEYIGASIGLITIGLYNFYLSLILLAAYPQVETSKQEQYLSNVQENQENLREWSDHAPQNFQHKYLLVQAETARVLGKNYEAGDFYDRAISGAKKNEYLQEEALANELAAKFYLNWGKDKVAAGYMQEAYYCYTRWGAKAKVIYLEEHYSELLGAILQPPNPALAPGGTISPTLMRSVTSSTSLNLWLDFPAVMKATQAISQEIELEKLLATLMQIAIASAGAQIGILLIHQEAKWLVVAKANQNHIENCQIPVVDCQELPQSLIYSVARTQKTAVFDNLSASSQFAGDRYIITHQPKSVLCIPISKQGKSIAILYLENNLTAAAFTSDRIETLQILTTQAAISIENALLYQQVENYSHSLEAEVERKTKALSQKAADLEQALKNLQQTQTQLIQSEKMSALGQLVAGIAHEINNPINFIYGNLQPTENYVKNLLSLLDLYQQQYPENNLSILEKAEEIELDFIKEDFTKILQSMKVGSERIKQIILSLRNFSRLDESDMKAVDLHTGIESTLLILQNRFQGSNNQPKIEVIKEYGNLPDVTCYASEMNQVFMSLINNGIDALKQVIKTNQNPFIQIQTEVVEKERVRIAIADNGNGIPTDIQKRIFEPFFTTKPVGSGTGLGLSVSYAIIKKHDGQLTCESTVGSGTKFVIEIPINYQGAVNSRGL